MSRQVRVGIVGTSWWTELMYLGSLKSHPQAHLAAICGRNQLRASELAKSHGIPQVYSDYQEMIDKGNLEALIVATPDDLHHPITLYALKAGLHVLCEKPLSNTSAQAKEMYQTAKASGVKHMALFTWRWVPHHWYLRQLLQEGYIGRVLHARLSFLNGYGKSSEYAWRFDAKRANGILGDLGSHMIDLARWCLGEVAKVSAHLGNFVERDRTDIPANDFAHLSLGFTSGAQANIEVSAVSQLADRGAQQQLCFYGENGTLEASFTFMGNEGGVQLRGMKSGESQFTPIAVPAALWSDLDPQSFNVMQLGHLFTRQSIGPRLFIDSIVHDQPVEPSFFDGFKTQQVVDAALESFWKGRHISLR